MGTDIHGVFQKRIGKSEVGGGDSTWELIQSRYEEGRHYQLFAALADVRNGYGFAGVPTGDAIEPISEPRGFPADIADRITDDYIVTPWKDSWGDNQKWLGDHSHSWLSGEEMLYWFEHRCPAVTKTGVISAEEYSVWNGKCPESYCGRVSGPNVKVIQADEADHYKIFGLPYSHVQVSWQSDLRDELGYFFDEVKRLTEEHGEIRFIFGFDS